LATEILFFYYGSIFAAFQPINLQGKLSRAFTSLRKFSEMALVFASEFYYLRMSFFSSLYEL
jgi:hypothetical protein